MMEKKISLTIDRRKIEVEEGTTILEAAKTAGIDIPNLCQYRELPGFGACRLCLVEVKDVREPVAACAYLVAPRMIVKTNTPLVIQARKIVLELLLSDHPLNCLTCEMCGECKLQDYAYDYGISESRFNGEKHDYQVDTSNPFFVRDYNKCIVCGRCVRACNEIEFDFAIDFKGRGFNTKIAAPFDEALQERPDCTFCGQCVESCPTSALLEKQRIGEGRTWDFKKVRTTCPYCGCGCTVELYVKDNKIVNVTSYEKGASNQGNLCVKGRFGIDFVNQPNRLATPLIKKSGKFVEASWDEALDLVAKHLKQVEAKNGPNAIGCISSARCTNEENYLMQKFARATIGTNNIDHCARL